jgi:Trypsin
MIGGLHLKPGHAEAKRLVDEGKEYPVGHVCALAGYGDTGNPRVDAKPHQLNFLPMPILKRSVCQKRKIFVDNMVCAGLLKISSGPCVVYFLTHKSFL